MSREEYLNELVRCNNELKVFSERLESLTTSFRGGDVSFSMVDSLKELDEKEFAALIKRMRKACKSRLAQKIKEIDI
jgi:hypothetical protein